VSGLKGLYEARLVLPGDSYKVSLSILWRDPPLKHHPTRARHRQQVAIPGGLGRITGQRAVRAMVSDEVFKVGKEVSFGSRDEFVGIDHSPTELLQGGLETMASFGTPPLYSSTRVMGLPALPFTPVEDDSYVAPAREVLA
jgi:hypothetical protein